MCHIRTALDPELGNKFAAHLMQGLSPFNLVYVCGFCSQFFDPDADGGVIVPNVQKVVYGRYFLICVY